jgi:hypothetical protein
VGGKVFKPGVFFMIGISFFGWREYKISPMRGQGEISTHFSKERYLIKMN